MTCDPKISVIIPVHNCSNTIGKCLDSLTELDHPSFEVIIVDDGSTDHTAAVCESYSGVKVVRIDKGGPSRARNVGIQTSRGVLIAFTDGDCAAEKDWLTELEKGFTSPEVAGVGGDQKSPDDDTDTGKRIQEFLKAIGFMTGYIKTDIVMKETEHNPTCNAMYRKEVLKEVGGFDEALWPGEDVDLDLKIRRRGYRLIYNPKACVSHYRPRTYRDFGRMMTRYGASQRYLVRKYGFFRRIHYEPAALILSIMFMIVAITWNQRLWPITLAPWPILFVWFYGKTRSIEKALQFCYLMTITMANWNWGFFTGRPNTISRSRK